MEDRALANTHCFFNDQGDFVVRLYDTEVFVLKKRPAVAPGVETSSDTSTKLAADTPVVEKPSTDATEAEAPAVETPTVQTPVTQAPPAKVTAAEQPAAEKPAAETPAAEQVIEPSGLVEGTVVAKSPDVSKEAAVAVVSDAAEERGSDPKTPGYVGDGDSGSAGASAKDIDAADKGSDKPLDAPEEHTHSQAEPAAPTTDAAVKNKHIAIGNVVLVLSSGKFRTAETRLVINEALQSLSLPHRVVEKEGPYHSGGDADDVPASWVLFAGNDTPDVDFEDGLKVNVDSSSVRASTVKRHFEDKASKRNNGSGHRDRDRDAQPHRRRTGPYDRDRGGYDQHRGGYDRGGYDSRPMVPAWGLLPRHPPGAYPPPLPMPPVPGWGAPPPGWRGPPPPAWGPPHPAWDAPGSPHHRPPPLYGGVGPRIPGAASIGAAPPRGPLPDGMFQ